MTIDKRARKILNDTFWSSSGWKREPKVSPEDFAYAKSKGLILSTESDLRFEHGDRKICTRIFMKWQKWRDSGGCAGLHAPVF